MFKIAFKDIKLFLSDKRGVMLTFLLPISLITLFSLAFGGGGERTSRPQRLVVSDEDKTETSRKIIAGLDSLKEIEVRLTSTDTAQRWIRKGDETAVLVFHKGLKQALDEGKDGAIELQYDQAKEMEIGILQSALIGNLMKIVGTGTMEKQVIEKFDSQHPEMDSITLNAIHHQIMDNFKASAEGGDDKDSGGSILTTTALVAEKENSPGLVQAVAGTAIMMLLFSVTAMGASLLDEKQEGTLKKLLYSPLPPSSILFGKMISTNLISMAQLFVMFIFSWLVFGLDIMQNIPSLLLMIFATAFACSGFGVFLASVAKSRSQVQGVSTLIILSMSAFGGSMIPIFLMPLWMQKVAVISVNYWGIQGFYDIYWRMLPFSDGTFLMRVGVLIGMGLLLNTIAVRMFKRNVLSLS